MTTAAWDPFATIRNTLWIGGAQWAGKSTIANLLAEKYGITAYHHDYHNARSHYARWVEKRARAGEPYAEPDFEWMWVTRTPAEMADELISEHFPQAFEWILDDLRALHSGRPILAEGWGLRPELVAPLADSPRRMVVMVPTEEFQRHQERTLERAGTLGRADLSDPERGQRNRIGRDRLVCEHAVATARELGIRVIEVDGSLDAHGVAGLVADHFEPYLV
jgi:hypothetical protein